MDNSKFFLIINSNGLIVDAQERFIDPEETKKNAIKILSGRKEKITFDSVSKTCIENPVYSVFVLPKCCTIEFVDKKTFEYVSSLLTNGSIVKRRMVKNGKMRST